MSGKPHSTGKGLSVTSALSYFLKGNRLFAINSITPYTIDMVACIFPPLFQQVYTDNIITHKNPEWFTPLMAFYVLLFLIELAVWVTFSILRRKSQAKLSIVTSSKYLWTVFQLPLSRLNQFTPGELVARYTTIAKTIKSLDFALPSTLLMLFPAFCIYLIMLFNWKLGLLEVFSVLLLAYVIRATAKMQKKIAMDLEVTESRLQNITMTGLNYVSFSKVLYSLKAH